MDMAGKYLYLCQDMYQVRNRKAPQAKEQMRVPVSEAVYFGHIQSAPYLLCTLYGNHNMYT